MVSCAINGYSNSAPKVNAVLILIEVSYINDESNPVMFNDGSYCACYKGRTHMIIINLIGKICQRGHFSIAATNKRSQYREY